ncbi:MAG: hypothetical protein ACLFPQ_03180 [Candidatus Woesearchaeota archaeon]
MSQYFNSGYGAVSYAPAGSYFSSRGSSASYGIGKPYSGSNSGEYSSVSYKPSSYSLYDSISASIIMDSIKEQSSKKETLDENPYGANSDYSSKYNTNPKSPKEHFSMFLSEDRRNVPFVNDFSEIREFAKDAFEKTTSQILPDDIEIYVLPYDEFKKAHMFYSGRWSEGIAGFSINKHNDFISVPGTVFVKQDDLDKVMIVLGHELGHIMTQSLDNPQDEEAKAFAFEYAWIKAIHENNIANLSFNIKKDLPARNNLHDVAYGFVVSLIRAGEDALSLFRGLVAGERSVASYSIEEKINAIIAVGGG